MKKLEQAIREAILYKKIEGRKVKCNTCNRHCIIPPGKVGFCKTRQNIDGKLYTLEYGLISSININPVEKKPLFHFWPGSSCLTFGSWSCTFVCCWCQNYDISKTVPNTENSIILTPQQLVELAIRDGCEGVSASFSEPTTFLEYSADVFELAKKETLHTSFITNGYFTLKALKFLAEKGCDAMNVDVKGDEEAVKKYCGSVDVKKVWRNIKAAKKLGIHIEITTLVIPGVNDDKRCLKEIADKIEKIDKNMPWHVTQYYPAYKALEAGLYPGRTPVETLEKAWRIGKESGLNYVYVGNVPGHRYENTYCHSCNELLIERFGFDVIKYKITPDNRCPECKEKIPIVGSGRISRYTPF